jgi:hypothetical protein
MATQYLMEKAILFLFNYTYSGYIQWARKALQCLAVLDYLQCGAIQLRNLT